LWMVRRNWYRIWDRGIWSTAYEYPNI